MSDNANIVRNVKQSQSGIGYTQPVVLKKSPQRITRAHFWRIQHDSGKIGISLKVGRYTYNNYGDEVEIKDPKSELTLDTEELQALVKYLKENYEPLKDGATQYISVDGQLNSVVAQQLKAFFNNPKKEELLSIILDNNILPVDLLQSLETRKRMQAIKDYESLLNREASEQEWQNWFEENCWVLGSDFVRIIDDRKIDVENVADFLVEAYDGFLDIIEIKKPSVDLKFWATTKYRDNDVPSKELVGTIMQATNYIYEIEREANSAKFFERIGCKVIKPRGILIYGRSHDWTTEQSEVFRLLNASYHNLTIMTYDHVLVRAKRMLGAENLQVDEDQEIPF